MVVVLLAAEVVARAVAPELPHWRARDGATILLTGHPTRLWGLAPGERDNLGATATINALGFRGPLPVEGRRRVIVLGDSSFFGHGVEDEQTLGAVMAQAAEVEVLNLAVPGYSSEQSLVVMEEQGWALQPDLLVVGSMWSDSGFDVVQDRDLLALRRGVQWNPLTHSALFRWVVTALSPARPLRFRRGEGTGPRRVPVQQYAENLDALARGGVPVIFVRPCPQVEARGQRTGHDWMPYVEAQRAVAEHHGQELLDACEVFAGHEDLFLDELHPSVEGHRLLGEALAARPWPSPSAAGPARVEVVDPWPEGPPVEGSPLGNLY